MGLTRLILDRDRLTYQFTNGPADVELEMVTAGTHAMAAVCAEIARQLNRPFPRDGMLNPFRFFTVDAGVGFHLGLAYDHFIAGGDSIAVLLRDVIGLYTERATSAVLPAPRALYPKTYRALFWRNAGYVLRGLNSLPSMIASCQRSCRPPARADTAGDTGFAYYRIDAEPLAALTHAAKAWGVTLNDAFLAALLKAVALMAPDRMHAVRRCEVAVASIMNIRAEFQPSAEETFGQFLASFRVSHLVPPSMSLRELARAIHVETDRVKSRKLYLQTLLALALSTMELRFLSIERQRRFYAKHYPIFAGVTTLNVNALWKAAAPERRSSLDYIRAVPTGPLAPLVFAISTSGDVANIGISFRTADVEGSTVDRVAGEFLGCIHNL